MISLQTLVEIVIIWENKIKKTNNCGIEILSYLLNTTNSNITRCVATFDFLSFREALEEKKFSPLSSPLNSSITSSSPSGGGGEIPYASSRLYTTYPIAIYRYELVEAKSSDASSES